MVVDANVISIRVPYGKLAPDTLYATISYAKEAPDGSPIIEGRTEPFIRISALDPELQRKVRKDLGLTKEMDIQ